MGYASLCPLTVTWPGLHPLPLQSLGQGYNPYLCRHPFDSESPLQILNCNYTIPLDSGYSTDLADLIVAMLAADPALRPTVFEVTERASLLYAERMAEAPLPASQPEEDPGFGALGGGAPEAFPDEAEAGGSGG